jgi:hypothetical protein
VVTAVISPARTTLWLVRRGTGRGSAVPTFYKRPVKSVQLSNKLRLDGLTRPTAGIAATGSPLRRRERLADLSVTRALGLQRMRMRAWGGMSTSGCYEWSARTESARAARRAELAVLVPCQPCRWRHGLTDRH